MKPRTIREAKAVALSKKLPPPTQAQIDYCYRHTFEHFAFRRRKDSDECICLECGHTFQYDKFDGKVCPHCHSRVELKVTKQRRKVKEKMAFQVITAIEDWQVVRTFHVFQSTKPGQPAEYSMLEVIQHWMQPGKKDIILARNRMCMNYSDTYCPNSELSIKDNNIYAPYYVWANVVYPRTKVLPILKRNGWNNKMLRLPPISSITYLMNDNRYETLVKTDRLDIWEGMRDCVSDYWDQIKLIIRHKYYPDDFSIWRDTIVMANRLGLDTHSPKYVMPNNIKELHDILNDRLRKLRKKEELKAKRERIAKHKTEEKNYKRRNKKLLAVTINVGDITIRPLQGYQDYVEEGESMHNCVETYWKKKRSLILSAQSGGERLATIELDKSDFHIVQCRAVCNAVPERYDEICNIINKNRPLFIRARK